MKTLIYSALTLAALSLVVLPAPPAEAGGFLESVDITAGTPSPIAGQVVAELVRIRWDERCIPVSYRVNDTQDPINNPAGPPVITLAEATTELQASFDVWNRIRTSYIDMRIVGNVTNPGVAGFDFVNELTFNTPAGFGAIASSPSTTLIADSFLADGDDLDGDGDSDVSSAISTCADVDNDGDIEFPEGSYVAGTILDNDVQYNAAGVRFTTDDADIDTTTFSTDLGAIAVHENGHSLGLSHVLDNQLSDHDGTATTMYPFIDTGDPDAERAQATLAEDDVAHASFYYPEGSAGSGPAALQHGDIPFHLVYGVVRGSVQHGAFGEPVLGASVAAVNLLTGRLGAAAFSGRARLSYNPATGGLFLISPAFNIANGDYEIPLPLGLYELAMEAPDGTPVPPGSISLTALVGDIFGQHTYNEESYNGNQEGAIEERPWQFTPVVAVPGLNVTGKNLVTNVQNEIASFGPTASVGFTGSDPGTYYAVRIPGAEVTAAAAGGDLWIQSADFLTYVADASVIPRFAEAVLTTGSVSGTTATVNLSRPLIRDRKFIGQDFDFAPLYSFDPSRLGDRVLAKIASGEIEDLFLVLRIPTSAPFPGVSGLPPLVGLSTAAPVSGNSYISEDGGATFDQVTNFDFQFRLTYTNP